MYSIILIERYLNMKLLILHELICEYKVRFPGRIKYHKMLIVL